jgi:hypothetical protein
MPAKTLPEQPIMYLSGMLVSFTNEQLDGWYKRTGCKHRCASFVYSCPGAFAYAKRMEADMAALKRAGGTVMMDSGGFSFLRFAASHNGQISLRKKLHFSNVEEFREQTVQLYIEYCKAHGKEWDFYVNFDYVRDSAKIYKMQKRLERAGIRPTPIYHGDSTIDWLRRYLDEGYTRIGISRTGSFLNYLRFRRFLDRVFNEAEKYRERIRFHGFALTAPALIVNYPWYSVDTANWLKVAAIGCIYTVDPHMYTAGTMSVSKRASSSVGTRRTAKAVYEFMPKEQQRSVRDAVELAGFDFGKLQVDLYERCLYNGYYIVRLFDILTELQAGKGHKALRWGSLFS